jgi:hypothetical protein
MKRKHLNQSGFIPLLVSIIIIVAVLIVFVYLRVLHAKH